MSKIEKKEVIKITPKGEALLAFNALVRESKHTWEECACRKCESIRRMGYNSELDYYGR